MDESSAPDTPSKGPIAPPGTPGKTTAAFPSAGDNKFSVTLLKYLPKGLEIDWAEFAREMGFKSDSIAKVRFNQVRRKLIAGPSSGGSPATSKVKKATKKQAPKAKRGSKSAAKEDETTEETAKKTTMSSDEDDDGDDGNAKAEASATLQALKNYIKDNAKEDK